MAKVWFSVIVLIFVQNVFANVSLNKQISSCDQCIRRGGSWCSKKMTEHCAFDTTDVWCGGEPEELTKIDFITTNGKTLQPGYIERTLFVGNPDSLQFAYLSPVERKVFLEVYNTTQSLDNIDLVAEDATCNGNRCHLTIEATVRPEFCTSFGTDMEFVFVKITVENMTEEALIKYHVPCACECTKKKERKSPWCNGNGDWACGVCNCYEGWSGEDCKKAECGTKRGDVQCNNPLRNDVECSGNGYCGPCETCVCYTDRDGSQYFDPTNFCSDICMDTNGCDQCLTKNAYGTCIKSPDSDSECSRPMTVLAYNETIAAERDEYDRKVWASCNDTFVVSKNQKCYVEYVAMRNEDGHINVMVVKSCNDHQAGAIAGTVDTKVPLILGVLGIVAAVAAVAGVMLWKHATATPPLPFSSPDYQNIDAEDCVGENPLYKSPTTTFTNPQFGKC